MESGGRIAGSLRASIVFPVGRAGEQEVVSTRRGDLERAPGSFLAPHVREIRLRSLGWMTVALDPGLRVTLAAEVGRSVREMVQRDRLDPGQCSFGAGTRRAEDRKPGEARSFRQGQHAADRPQGSVEAQFADRCMIVQPLARDLAGGAKDRQRNGQVEP